MSVLQSPRRKASSRKQIDVEGIKDRVLMLPHSQYRMILSVSSVNFELKSQDEQDAIIDTYESFINSVGCPLQILIRTREIDMDKYLDDLSVDRRRETDAIYCAQLENYGDFIRRLITNNKILTRSFYIVVPHAPNRNSDFASAREQLRLKVDIVRKGIARLGMSARILSDLEILDLFYSFYSPERAKLQPLSAQALNLLHAEYVQKEVARE